MSAIRRVDRNYHFACFGSMEIPKSVFGQVLLIGFVFNIAISTMNHLQRATIFFKQYCICCQNLTRSINYSTTFVRSSNIFDTSVRMFGCISDVQ